MRSSLITVLVSAALFASLPGTLHADTPTRSGKRPPHARPAKEKPAEETAAPTEDAKKDAPDEEGAGLPPGTILGPSKVKFLDQATLDLPAGYVFMDKQHTTELLSKLGNPPDERTVGAIFPAQVAEEGKGYWFLVEWDAAGYVKDDDADDLNADDILENYKQGTEEANKFREEKGLPALHVVGWDEKPRYDKTRKHVVWALRGRSARGDSTNYNTRLLGRNGYLSVNLICGPEQIEGLKPVAADMLGRVTYDNGKRYADYNKDTDKTAEFGVAALVIGGAALAGKAAKVGILAKFGKVIIAGLFALKKGIALLIVGVIAFFKRLFGGKQKEAPAADPTQQTGSIDASDTAAGGSSTGQPGADFFAGKGGSPDGAGEGGSAPAAEAPAAPVSSSSNEPEKT